MSEVASKLKPETAEADGEAKWSLDKLAHTAPRRRLRVLPVLLTVLVAAIAVMFGRAMWDAYMSTPWTRDATVRAYVVTMAPEVAGRIVELPVRDNLFVHKDDLLMAIDPTNYKIAVGEADASVQQAQADVQNIDAQIEVQQAQIRANQAQLDQARAALVFAQQQAGTIGPWHKMASAAFRMPSSSRPSCISRRLRYRLQTQTSFWRMSGRRPVVKGLVEALRMYRVRSCLRPVGAGNECPAGPDAGPHGSSPNQQNALVTALPFPRASEPSVGSHRFAVALDADRLAAKPRSC